MWCTQNVSLQFTLDIQSQAQKNMAKQSESIIEYHWWPTYVAATQAPEPEPYTKPPNPWDSTPKSPNPFDCTPLESS